MIFFIFLLREIITYKKAFKIVSFSDDSLLYLY